MASVRWRPPREQPRVPGLGQEQVQDVATVVVPGQAVPELAEHRVVEARVRQFQAQRVLPVDPAADGLRGLTVGEVLGARRCWARRR